MNHPFDSLSFTALGIALKTYGLSIDPRFSPFLKHSTRHFYQYLFEHNSEFFFPLMSKGIRKTFLRNLVHRLNEYILEGDIGHVLFRKRITDIWLNRFPPDQFLNFGAGLDHQASTWASKRIKSIEIDTMVMSEIKRTLTSTLPIRPHYLGIEPNEFRAETLRAQFLNFDPNLPITILTEGFLDYLTGYEIHLLFDELGRYFNHRIELISTIFDLDKMPLTKAQTLLKSVASVGEPIKHGTNLEWMMDFLSSRGFVITEVATWQEMNQLIRLHKLPLSVFEGFYMLKSHRS